MDNWEPFKDKWQDWNTVGWKKPPKKETTSGEVVSRDRYAEAKVAKLDLVNDAEHVQKTSLELRKQIQTARLARKMSQKDLATAINEKPQVIQAYEAGKATPDHKVLQKLRRALGVKLSKN